MTHIAITATRNGRGNSIKEAIKMLLLQGSIKIDELKKIKVYKGESLDMTQTGEVFDLSGEDPKIIAENTTKKLLAQTAEELGTAIP